MALHATQQMRSYVVGVIEAALSLPAGTPSCVIDQEAEYARADTGISTDESTLNEQVKSATRKLKNG